MDPIDEHFMVWMQNSGLITKYKTWGHIDQTLPAGKYNLVASNNYRIGDMRIKKGVQIAKISEIGSTVYFYPVIFILMAGACFAYAIFLRVKFPDFDKLLK